MRPLLLAAAGLAVGLGFPAAGAALGATGPVLALLGAVPVLLALAGGALGRQAVARATVEDGLARAGRERRDEAGRAASEIQQHAKALATAVAALTGSAEEALAVVRTTSDTVTRLGGSTTASALTAETVVRRAVESERAAARGLSIAERSREALERLAAEVHALAGLVAGLDARMREVLEVSDALHHVAERSRALSSMARIQADGGLLAAEAIPALVARMDGQVEETVLAAARARAILGEMHREVAAAMQAAEAGSVRAGEGAMVLEGAAGALRELASALATSAASGKEIAQVAHQQDVGVEHLREAMNGIFLACERSRGSTREVEEEARALGALAARLRRSSRPEQ